jgi:uncharacterized protein
MLPNPKEIPFEDLSQRVIAQFKGDIHSIHGLAHWRRVEQNGALLCSRTGADFIVVRLFALFHDACRADEGEDDGHGARGAVLAGSWRGKFFHLDDARFNLLEAACRNHTDGGVSPDITIGTCWDADRLDLGRVGLIPREEYMSTPFGKEIARAGSIYPFMFGTSTRRAE